MNQIKKITLCESQFLKNSWHQWKHQQHGIVNNESHLEYMIKYPMLGVLNHKDIGKHTETIQIFQKNYLESLVKLKKVCGISEDKFDNEMISILKKYPEIKSSGIFNVLANTKGSNCIYRQVEDNKQIFYTYDFKNWTDNDVMTFITRTQVKDILLFYDYSHIRPFIQGKISEMVSRSIPNNVGKANEKILQSDINLIGNCFNNIKIKRQMSNKSLLNELGISLATSRFIWDTVAFYKKRVVCMEFSYYTTGGTKPKATSKQFQDRQRYCQDNGYIFIWITDGVGWKFNKNDLRQAINGITYVLNTQLLRQGALWFIFNCIDKINGE